MHCEIHFRKDMICPADNTMVLFIIITALQLFGKLHTIRTKESIFHTQ